MGIRATEIVLSVGFGLLAIHATHSLLIVDVCLDMSGAIDEETGACLDEG
jgi:hypothetical protein